MEVIQVPLMYDIDFQLVLFVVFVQIHGYYSREIMTQFEVVVLVEMVAELEGIILLTSGKVFALHGILEGHQTLVVRCHSQQRSFLGLLLFLLFSL